MSRGSPCGTLSAANDIRHSAWAEQVKGTEERGSGYYFRTRAVSVELLDFCKLLNKLEARAGIEPAHKGFADLSLTTWVPRLIGPALSRTPG